MFKAIDSILEQAPALPVVTIHSVEQASALADALVSAGLPVIEVTLRTDCALEAIRAMSEVDGAIVGAGTVLTPADLERVASAGAAFAISPGCTGALYRAAAAADILFLPAVATASEIMTGLEHGHARFKFFPAEASGGIEALKGFAGPFPDVKFCPTGGISTKNAPDYLRQRNVITVGGSWMAPQDAIAAEDWARIRALANDCVNTCKTN